DHARRGDEAHTRDRRDEQEPGDGSRVGHAPGRQGLPGQTDRRQGAHGEDRCDQIGRANVARQISLREFQQALAQRLREAQTEAEPTSRLGVQAGSGNWLLKLDDAGEMLPLPEISGVPLTRPWYLGLANIRGVLASVVDFAAFAGGEPTARTPEC